MKKFLSLTLLCLISITYSCKKVLIEEEKVQTPSIFSIMTNPQDPLLLSAVIEGVTIDYYGLRDDNGIPSMVNQFVVSKPNDTTIFVLDDIGRPETVFTQNGTQFNFNWLDDKRAALTVISGDGETQINTVIDLSKKQSMAPSNLATKNNATTSRIGRKLSLRFKPVLTEIVKEDAQTFQNLIINVSACGNPVEKEKVYVVARTTSGGSLGFFPATNIGNGKYGASIPTNLVTPINPFNTCNKIAKIMEYTCFIAGLPGLSFVLCNSLATAMTVSGVGIPAAAAIASSCASVSAGFEFTCQVINGPELVPGSLVDGTPNLLGAICNAKSINRNFNEIKLYAYINGLPDKVRSDLVTAPGDGPFPNLSIISKAESRIKKLTLNPSAPQQGVDYEALTDVECLLAGTVVKIKVLGSDQYEDEISYTVSSQSPKGQFTLSVPGADADVQDIVTVTILLPNGKVLTRVASLVFKA